MKTLMLVLGLCLSFQATASDKKVVQTKGDPKGVECAYKASSVSLHANTNPRARSSAVRLNTNPGPVDR